MDKKYLIEAFQYHAPFGDQPKRYKTIRDYMAVVAEVVLELCPHSAERTLAIRKLQEATMWANASNAINEKPELETVTIPVPPPTTEFFPEDQTPAEGEAFPEEQADPSQEPPG